MILLAMTLGCIDPYPIQVIEEEAVIVVDASFTTELKRHEVILSYSVSLDVEDLEPLVGASVQISVGDGTTILYNELEPGMYFSDSIAGIPGVSYQLEVVTTDSRTLTSTIETIPNPGVVDSLYGRFISFVDAETGQLQKGIQLMVDVSNELEVNSSYRFEFTEEYEYNVPYPSAFQWNEATMTIGNRPEVVGTCYLANKSDYLIHASTNGFNTNTLTEFPVRFLNEVNPELNHAYVIELKQFSITDEAYRFQRNLKEINESGGSFFDRQKGTVFGNIETDDPDFIILGYFEVAAVTNATETFRATDFPDEEFEPNFNHFCWENAFTDIFDTVAVGGLNDYFSLGVNSDKEIISVADGLAITAPYGCTDCRRWGGSINKSSLWD